ncbi:hypothetical protein D3C73_1191820 [compost metagenome]
MLAKQARRMYLLKISSKAQSTCESLMLQARATPKGAKPTLFRYKFPKSLMPPSNMPNTLCDNKIMATEKRKMA